MNIPSFIFFFSCRPIIFMKLRSKFDEAIIVIYGPPTVTCIRYDDDSHKFQKLAIFFV